MSRNDPLRVAAARERSSVKVMIFPTLLAGGWIWDQQIPIFEKFGLHVRQVAEPFVNFENASTVESLLDRCEAMLGPDPEPWILVGNSFGGMIALKLARALGPRVLAVVAGGCPGLGEMANLGIGTRAMLSPTYAAEIRNKLFAVPDRATPNMIKQALSQVRGRRAAAAGVRLLRSVRSVDMATDISAIRTPTALIWGAQDQVTPPGPWKERVRELPNFSFHEIDDAGHCPMFETPAAFNAALLSFLTSVL